MPQTMSDGFDQLARMLADAVVGRLRDSGQIPSAGQSYFDGSQAPASVPAPYAEARQPHPAANPAPIAPGLFQGKLWHPDSPRTFADERVKKGEVPIGVSARHCHVTQEALEVLFGKGAKLNFHRPLMQEGEFAAAERLTVRGPGGQIEGVRILGPTRNLVQVEVAQTDLRTLGMTAPVRPSGTHDGSSGALLIGPAGQWKMERGVIRANRHIHLSQKNAADLGLKENDVVAVHVPGVKPTSFYDVQIRVRDTFRAQFHLDTDDGNALDVKDGDVAHIIQKIGHL
jgi:putative phosphotransacetylase